MALDSRNKRASALGVNPLVAILPTPDGVVDAGDRAQLARAYPRRAANPPPLGWQIIRAGQIRARVTAR